MTEFQEYPKALYAKNHKGETITKIVPDAEAQAKAGKSWKEDPPAPPPDADEQAADNEPVDDKPKKSK